VGLVVPRSRERRSGARAAAHDAGGRTEGA
jgi:hypothetical protein